MLVVDVNGDGKPDVYVANDTVDKFLYLNRSTPGQDPLRGGGRWPAARPATTAAAPTAAWAWTPATTTAAAGRRCGSPTTRTSCTACTATSSGQDARLFHFQTPAAGIAAIGQKYVGWGTGFLDVDLDGWEDLFVANGHAIRYPHGHGRRPQAAAGAVAQPRRQVQGRQPAGRRLLTQPTTWPAASAFGDLDNDGRIDLVISHLNEPVAVLRNVGGAGNHWLGVQLVGKDHADVVGARVVLEAGGRKQTRFAKGGGSYASSRTGGWSSAWARRTDRQADRHLAGRHTAGVGRRWAWTAITSWFRASRRRVSSRLRK